MKQLRKAWRIMAGVGSAAAIAWSIWKIMDYTKTIGFTDGSEINWHIIGCEAVIVICGYILLWVIHKPFWKNNIKGR